VIVEITAAATHTLRRAVLRNGDPDADVVFDGDDAEGSVHLGVVSDGWLVAVASWIAHDDGSVQLRGMATDPSMQGRGIGTELVTSGTDRFAGRAVWADARDSAIAFYEQLGWVVEGDGFVTPATGLPHHRIRWRGMPAP
jgi:GNAT superfamily N-acetyltransferase